VETTLRFRAISAGGRHTCAISVDGTAYCWGDNARGQLGALSPRVAGAPVPVASDHSFVGISAGADHTCGLDTDGAVFCWGGNGSGQLGAGTFRASALPVRVQAEVRFESLSAGSARTCGATTDGTVLCWGNIWEATREGTEVARRQALPAAVPSSPSLRSVSVGPLTTCGTSADGVAYCWEANGFGQLGSGGLAGTRSPVAVAGALTFAQVAAGATHTCGIAAERTAYCWGSNAVGQLGDHRSANSCGRPAFPCSPVPNAVAGRLRFTSISTGLGNHVCGVTTLTNIYCWGLGVSGQLGIGAAGARVRLEPTLVAARPAS
jgi:alpha-tubulin suppressor-like RCC1 family protein